MFTIYLKLNNKSNLKAGYYELSPNLGVKKIVSILEKGSTYNHLIISNIRLRMIGVFMCA